MTDLPDDEKQLSPLKRALVAINEFQVKLENLENRAHEPIAVIGIGCKFPHADGPEEFWQVLQNGIDAIVPVPADRWDADSVYDPEPNQAGKMITRNGGFLDAVDEFDPLFFNISPREAERMDPQQRLLLQVIWEAFEYAGILPDKIAGSRTGVYIGISSNDYSLLQQGDLRWVDAYSGTGNAFSIAANRISYTYDLQGPSVAVDTACSSSLLATHLAVQSLRNQEINLAIAGGVNLILSPELTIAFSQAGMMSPDGRCKTFDAAADGYGRGEGCGVVLLKRLSDAIRDGDTIHSLILGTAVNQDGRSNGLTAPNGLAQQQVIRAAIADARLAANDLDYLEAHGTGTILGDPIEMRAINAVMEGRSHKNPLIVGSVKTNIGHLESAAGIAGLIKVILSIKHEEIPPHLHFNTINPYIDTSGMPIQIPVKRTPWKSGKKIRYAGVSSFGFGGTNAHVVLSDSTDLMSFYAEKTQKSAENIKLERPVHILSLSARNRTSLRALIDRYINYLDSTLISRVSPRTNLTDICYTTNTSRHHHEIRLAIPARSIQELQGKLVESATNEDLFADPGDGIFVGEYYNKKQRKVAFLFTGQGAQYPDMGFGLYLSQPVFKQAVEECLEILERNKIDKPLGVPLRSLLISDKLEKHKHKGKQTNPDLLHETSYTQIALFVIEYALAKMWISWGINPDYLIGHSVGEYVAACIAKVFSLEDGLKLIAARGRLMQSLSEGGGMAAVFADKDLVAEFVDSYEDKLSVAAVNGPSNVVISGDGETLGTLIEEMKAEGVTIRRLQVSHAFHSPLMDPILAPFFEVANQVQYKKPEIKIISNLTGTVIPDDQVPDANYWTKHIRNPVLFNEGIIALAEARVEIFIETGPNPTLIGMAKRCLPEYQAIWVPSLKKDSDDWKILSESLSTLYVRGYDLNWKKIDQDYSKWMNRIPSELPTYPFNNERYWFDTGTIRLTGSELQLPDKYIQDGLDPTIELTETDIVDIIKQLASRLGESSKKEVLGLLTQEKQADLDLQRSISLEKLDIDPSITLENITQSDPKYRHGMIVTLIRSELARVLKTKAERLDVNRPINYMGLDSIMAIELRNRFEKILHLDIPISNLLQDLSIEQLAVQLSGIMIAREAEQQEQVSREIKSDENVSGVGVFPLSHGQKAMWVQHIVAPMSIQNPVYAVRIHSEFDVVTLERILKVLTKWHPTLRTTFELQEGEPVQIVHETFDVFFRAVDVKYMSDGQLRKYMNDEAGRAYNLETGPLFRVYQLSRSSDDHILLIAAHHIVIDLWSMAIILNQLTVLYRAVMNAKVEIEDLESPVKFKYTDYVRWQSEMLESKEGEGYWEYWKSKLDGDLPVLQLPADNPRPAVQTFRGASLSFMLENSLSEKLQSLADQKGSTLFQVLMTAFNVFLYRYTGRNDIIIGSPMIGRGHPEFTGIVGYFVNPVPIRTKLDSSISFTDLLTEVRNNVLEAISRQNYPFSLLVEKLQPERDPSRLPVFQVMFVYQKTHPEYDDRLSKFALDIEGLKMNVAGLELETVRVDQRSAPFEFTLMMAEADNTLGATITYNVDLFSQKTVQRFWDHFKNLLENIIQDSEAPISNLKILKGDELNHLLYVLNMTRMQYPTDRCIHQLFEEQVRRTPDAIAVSFDGESLTYNQLNISANRLGHLLQQVGVGPEVVIGLCMDRSINMIVGLLSIIKAGGAYLPIDPVYPEERIQYMIEDANVPIVLTHSSLSKKCENFDINFLYLDQDWGEQVEALNGLDKGELIDLEMHDGNPVSGVDPANLAYVIYTSGSTGRSKGVMLRHEGLINLVQAQTRGFGVGEKSKVLQFASISFDASVSEIFMALITGAQLVLARKEIMMSAPELEALIANEQITTITLPPSLLDLIQPEKLSSLKSVISAGEACTSDIAAKWGASSAFYNAYGPTECTIGPSYYRYEPTGIEEEDYSISNRSAIENGKYRRSIPIGRPIDNTQIYLLDTDFQPVPYGAAGEICIAGVGLARGYLERPELTADKFIPNPFAIIEGDRLYRTGDIGRFQPDGNIEFIGRSDYQVKVRGFRVELGEIESILNTHTDVRQAVVVADGRTHSDRRLVAYVVPKDNRELNSDVLRSQIKKHLPEYMIPSVFQIMEVLPLTPSGKIDRKQLPKVQINTSTHDTAYVPPSTEMERSIAVIWQDVLGVVSVGLDDNFFDLGGHSLAMTKAHLRIQEALGREFSIVELFSHPTIRSFTKFLNEDPMDYTRVKESIGRADKQKESLQKQRERMRSITQERASTTIKNQRRHPVQNGNSINQRRSKDSTKDITNDEGQETPSPDIEID